MVRISTKIFPVLLIMTIVASLLSVAFSIYILSQDTVDENYELAINTVITPTSTPHAGTVELIPLTNVTTPVYIFPNISSIVEKVRPAIVSVVAEVAVSDYFGNVRNSTQSGSGAIFDTSGYIFTNNHVVENAESITITFDDGRQISADLVGTDRLTDLAILKTAEDNLPHITIASPDKLEVGDWVIAIGNALALPGGPTVTFGIVSGLDRSFAVEPGLQLYGLIQTDASINPGNSGGPLLNLDGEVVGINTAVARGDVSGTNVEGIGFAIGMDTFSAVSKELIESGSVRWPWLGIFLEELNAETAAHLGIPMRKGVVFTEVIENGPAWNAGIRSSDIALSLAGENVYTIRDVIRLLRLRRHKVGDKVAVEIFREDRSIIFIVELGERQQ